MGCLCQIDICYLGIGLMSSQEMDIAKLVLLMLGKLLPSGFCKLSQKYLQELVSQRQSQY